VAGQPTVTVTGNAVRVVGLGNGISPEFDLPTGTTEIKASVCSSNQVQPFAQLYDTNDTMLGFIVDPVYQAKNLAGGKYYLTVSANPDCVWTFDLTPP
jgi:hypothetical protein